MPTHAIIETFWPEIRGYAQRLVADLPDPDMVAQPIDGVVMNHPAWILGHLGAYGPALTAALKGDSITDPVDLPCGWGSTPSPNRDDYPSRDDLLRAFIDGYDAAMDAYARTPESRLAEPPPLDRWAARFPTIGHLPLQFIVRHNMIHLGQLSAWRRAMNRPPV